MSDIFEQLDSLTDPRRRCFLCGTDLCLAGGTDEHVVPKWAQRRYDLWEQSVTLLNGTDLKYRQLTVPCCPTCNSTHLRSVEDSLCQTVDCGRDAVAALPSKTLFVWLGKVFYGLLYKELMLLRDRADPGSGTIITPKFLEQYNAHRVLLQHARGVIKFHADFEPGSIFVFECQSVGKRSYIWDLLDCVPAFTLGVRVGRVGLIAALGDGGAQKSVFEDDYARYYGLPLHPIQFRELFSRAAYRATLATRTPKYVFLDGNRDGQRVLEALQLPLGGFSMKPLFEEGSASEYAKFLSMYVGAPLEDISSPPDLVERYPM